MMLPDYTSPLGWYWAWFPLDIMLRIEAKQLKLGFIRPENLVSHSLSPLGA